jgi:hypothetical protein
VIKHCRILRMKTVRLKNMKKKHAWIWLVSGIGLMIGMTPIPISWICSGIIEGDPRAQYLNGLGQIAGFLGMTETKSELTYKADLINQDLVEVNVEFASVEESEDVLDRLFYTKKGGRFGGYSWRGNAEDANLTFKVKSSAEQDFREAIEEVKEAREARETEEAKEVREASERVQRKKTWSNIPRPLPIAPRNLRMPRIEETKQSDTDQPATHPESKSEDDDKTQPESEGRSQ